MDPITSARGRKRAENEIATSRRQLESIELQRKDALCQFDGMTAMVEGEIRGFEDAIRDYDSRDGVQVTLQGRTD